MTTQWHTASLLGLMVLVACQVDQQPEEAVQVYRVEDDPTPVVVLETSIGDIVLELNRERAPRSVASILYHVRGGFYNGLVFHRVMPGFVIQTGILKPDFTQRLSKAVAIENEAANGLKNLRGTVAMARTRDPNSAIAQFFINLKNSPELDFRDSTLDGFGYAVFGKVIEGMDVVDSIGKGPVEQRGRLESFPVNPVVIRRAYVREPSLEKADTATA
jgi:cyclophilin family peptidyl-prolyl cis-trans isomerase